jgi:hypothetical protein
MGRRFSTIGRHPERTSRRLQPFTKGESQAAEKIPTPRERPAEAEVPKSVDRDMQMNVKLNVNDNDVQFARSSMRRQADKEVREARWSAYADIGAA